MATGTPRVKLHPTTARISVQFVGTITQCRTSGFRGRVGIFEVFAVDDQIRRLIVERCDANTLRAAAINKGMTTMLQDGLSKAFLGETTIEEVLQAAL